MHRRWANSSPASRPARPGVPGPAADGEGPPSRSPDSTLRSFLGPVHHASPGQDMEAPEGTVASTRRPRATSRLVVVVSERRSIATRSHLAATSRLDRYQGSRIAPRAGVGIFQPLRASLTIGIHSWRSQEAYPPIETQGLDSCPPSFRRSVYNRWTTAWGGPPSCQGFRLCGRRNLSSGGRWIRVERAGACRSCGAPRSSQARRDSAGAG